MNIIIIAGMPASGKTTIANKLGIAFGYPILEKDSIKEELFDIIGFDSTRKRGGMMSRPPLFFSDVQRLCFKVGCRSFASIISGRNRSPGCSPSLIARAANVLQFFLVATLMFSTGVTSRGMTSICVILGIFCRSIILHGKGTA